MLWPRLNARAFLRWIAYNLRFEGMGKPMLRLMRLRLARGLLAASIVSLSVASAWAFTRENLSSGGDSNYSFDDPDKKDNRSSGPTIQPLGSNGPVVQFGVQQGSSSSFGRGSNYNTSPPDPYFRSLLNGR
jgi:hypothetical protein